MSRGPALTVRVTHGGYGWLPAVAAVLSAVPPHSNFGQVRTTELYLNHGTHVRRVGTSVRAQAM